MDSINDDCKTNSTAVVDSPQKNSSKPKKGEFPTSEVSKSENLLSLANEGNPYTIVENSQMESNNQLKLENNNLQLQLESSLNAINSIKKIDEDKVENKKNSENVAELQALVKNYKSTIDSLEKKLEDKVQKKYRSESSSESEDEQSDHSAYNPFNRNTKSGDSSRKRGRSKKAVKTGKKSRGRPRKPVVDDQSSNSATEPREKKSRGRPRKTLVEDDNDSLSNVEPPVKKSRGRPKKPAAEADQSSNSVKEKDSDNIIQDSDTTESKEKESANSNENSGDKEKVVVEKSKNNEDNAEKKQKGRPKKHFNLEVEIKDKKPRGRPKSNVTSEIEKDLPINIDGSIVKSRGRPKKNKSVIENVDVNDSS